MITYGNAIVNKSRAKKPNLLSSFYNDVVCLVLVSATKLNFLLCIWSLKNN